MSCYSNILLWHLITYFNFKSSCCKYTINHTCPNTLSLGSQYPLFNDWYLVCTVIPFLYVHACA